MSSTADSRKGSISSKLIGEKKHAVISPSKATRAITCPASVVLSEWVKQFFKEESNNESADYGTLVHSYFEMLIGNMPFVITDHEAYDEAITYVQYLKKRLATFERYKAEMRLRLKGSKYIFGTADVVAYHRDTIYIGDLKTGYNEVAAEDNQQLLTYATMYYSNLIDKKRKRNFILEIYQPKVDNIVHVDVSQEQLEEHWRILVDVEDQIINPKRQITIQCGGHCGWCIGKVVCPVIHERVKEVVNNPDTLLKENVFMIDVMKRLASEASDVLKARLASGLKMPDVALSNPRMLQQWNDEDGAVRVMKKHGLTQTDIFDYRILSPAATKKRLPKEHWKELERYITQYEGPRWLKIGK